MRLYHFINEQYGLQALLKKRLKLARISQLNDPFDFAAIDGSNDELPEMENHIESFDKKYGLLCFSEVWSNPVQWAHYSDKHKGLCLGFDCNVSPMKMEYSEKRVPPDELVALKNDILNELVTKVKKAEMDNYGTSSEKIDAMMRGVLQNHPSEEKLGEWLTRNLNTKFSHWSYEKEWRIFADLKENIDGLYYYDFSDNSNSVLKLKEVIIGLRSNLTPVEIKDTFRVPAAFKVRKHDRKFAMIKDEVSTP